MPMDRVTAAQQFMNDAVRAIKRAQQAKTCAPAAAQPSLDAALNALYGAVMAAIFTSAE